MKTLQHPVFIVCAALGMANRLLELNNWYIWPVHAYLDDLICFPLTLTFILAVQRSYFKDDSLIIPKWQIVFALLAFTLCFEIILPLFKDIYTADMLDIVAYSMGALVFHAFVNKPLASEPVH